MERKGVVCKEGRPKEGQDRQGMARREREREVKVRDGYATPFKAREG